MIIEKSNKIDITVAMPLWDMKNISWLQLESLCRQETQYTWELIVCEEQLENFTGEEEIRSYESRLKKAGCQSITYIPLKKRIPLSRKWIMIAEKARGTNYILCAGDNYSPPNRVELTHGKMIKGYNWFDVGIGLFLNLKTFNTGSYDHNLSPWKDPEESTALFMAANTKLLKRLTVLLYDHSVEWPIFHIDSWLKSRIGEKTTIRYRHPSELLGIHTDGANQITGKLTSTVRPHMYDIKHLKNNKPEPPFKASTQTIEEILPPHILAKLEEQFKEFQWPKPEIKPEIPEPKPEPKPFVNPHANLIREWSPHQREISTIKETPEGEPKELILEIFFKNYDFNNKNVIEFGPCMTENRMGILRHLSSKDANLYAIDTCDRYGQTHRNARELAKQHNIELTIADYSHALRFPEDEQGLKQRYKFLEADFFDVILCQCSISYHDLNNFLVLCNLIGKKRCKVFFLPWVEPKSPKINLDSFNCAKYNFEISQPNINLVKKINNSEKCNIIVTKNISYDLSKI